MSILGTILEGLATVGQNSWTEEEKKKIIEVQELLKLHGYSDEAKGLQKVINNFNLGVTRSSTTSTTSTTKTTTSSTTDTIPEQYIKLKKYVPMRAGSLDAVITMNSNDITITLKFISQIYYTITVRDYHIIDMKKCRNSVLYEDEFNKYITKLDNALGVIRS